MAIEGWQPQEDGLQEICKLLEQYRLPIVDQSCIWQKHQRCSQLPDFNNYLAFILCRAEGDVVNIRQAARLLLKNNFKSSYHLIQPAHLQYMKAEVVPCLGSLDFGIRTTVGTIISKDLPKILDSEVPGFADRPIAIFILRLLQVGLGYC
ncbi:hypothetical protein KC19_VG167700 [Ceratodon purpureus]|uniref:Importin N-terminal domain-containing protein n=1 Tax=Ceratodon purpureus TaxID=3225 RepID=A0A8T0HRA0_CERPU|nr:hypothetical protein KC19_VG167700 [Ceratodon purpureus]